MGLGLAGASCYRGAGRYDVLDLRQQLRAKWPHVGAVLARVRVRVTVGVGVRFKG